MIFATAFVLHRAYSAGRSARWSRNFGGAIAAAFVVFAAYHAYTDELLVHGLLFGGMTAAVAVKTRALIRRVHEGDAEKERRLKVAAKVGAREFSLSRLLSFSGSRGLMGGSLRGGWVCVVERRSASVWWADAGEEGRGAAVGVGVGVAWVVACVDGGGGVYVYGAGRGVDDGGGGGPGKGDGAVCVAG